MSLILYHHKVKKDLKNLDKNIAREILSLIPTLADEPTQGVRLAGELHDFCKYTFSLKGVSYRIIYKILVEPEKGLWILFVGTRENIYDRILRRIR